MKDQNLLVVSNQSSPQVCPPYVVTAVIHSQQPVVELAQRRSIELAVMNETQVLRCITAPAAPTSLGVNQRIEQGFYGSENIINDNIRIIETSPQADDYKNLPQSEAPDCDEKLSFSELEFNPDLAAQLEEFHQSVLLVKSRENASPLMNSLLQSFFESEEEKLLASMVQRCEFQLMALKTRQMLLAELCGTGNAEDLQTFVTMDLREVKHRLEKASRELLPFFLADEDTYDVRPSFFQWNAPQDWDGRFKRDILYDEQGIAQVLNDEARKTVFDFCCQYVEYCISLLVVEFQEEADTSTLEAFYRQLQAQQVCCGFLAEEKSQAFQAWQQELSLLRSERQQRYAQLLMHSGLVSNTVVSEEGFVQPSSNPPSDSSLSDGIFEPHKLELEEPNVKETALCRLPELPNVYQLILTAKTLAALGKRLSQQPKIGMGLNIKHWDKFIGKLSELSPLNYTLPAHKRFFLQLAAILPKSFYLPLPALVSNQQANLCWLPSKGQLASGKLYIHLTKNTLICKALRADATEKSKTSVRCEITAQELDEHLGKGAFQLFKSNGSSWAHYLLGSPDNSFDWMKSALRDDLFTLVKKRCELVNSFDDIDSLLAAADGSVSRESIYSLKPWVADEAKKLQLMKELLIAGFAQRYLPALDINKSYRNKTLLQRLCRQQPLNYSQIIQALLLGASSKDLPPSIHENAIVLLNWVKEIEDFRRTKLVDMIIHSSSNADLSKLYQRWQALRNGIVEVPNDKDHPIVLNNTGFHLFPEDCLRMAEKLGSLLRKNKTIKPAVYQAMGSIYTKLSDAAHQSNQINGHDDLLLSPELETLINKTANQWWQDMPRVFKKWFEQLQDPFNEAKKSKTAPLKKRGPDGKMVIYSLGSDSEPFAMVVRGMTALIEQLRADSARIQAEQQKIMQIFLEGANQVAVLEAKMNSLVAVNKSLTDKMNQMEIDAAKKEKKQQEQIDDLKKQFALFIKQQSTSLPTNNVNSSKTEQDNNIIPTGEFSTEEEKNEKFNSVNGTNEAYDRSTSNFSPVFWTNQTVPSVGVTQQQPTTLNQPTANNPKHVSDLGSGPS